MTRYIAIGDYSGIYRETAQGVAMRDPEALRTAAAALKVLLPKGATLIPMPGHTGRADTTLELCRILAGTFRFRICDCLECSPHESLHELKRREQAHGLPKGSLMPSPQALAMRLRQLPPRTANVCIVDNVIASGTTAIAAEQLLPGTRVFVIADDIQYPKRKGVVNDKEKYQEERSLHWEGLYTPKYEYGKRRYW